MIPASSLPPSALVFTHVLESGENINISISHLRSFLRSRPREPHRVPVDPHMAHSWIKQNIVSTERIEELAARYASDPSTFEPVILCHDGSYTNGAPDVFFADGHHRYCIWAFCGVSSILAYLVPEDEWRPYLVSGLRPLTSTELLSLPNLKRNY